MPLPDMITDRAAADAERWEYLRDALDSGGWGSLTDEEKNEWLTCVKGGYNYTDLNRVGEAVSYLGGRFIQLVDHFTDYRKQYDVAHDELLDVPYKKRDVALAPKTDWHRDDVFFASQAAQYLADLTVLRGLISLPDNTAVVPPDMEGLTIEEANDIEKLLVAVDSAATRLTELLELWIRNTAAAWAFCGEPFCGEMNTT